MPDLRPMDFGEILDGSLMIYRRHFGLFLKLAMAALSVPLVLLVYFGLRAIAELQQNPVRALLYLVPVGLVYYVASLVLTAGTIRVISDSYLGREPRLRDALSLGWSRLWPFTAVGFGKGIVLMLITVGVGVVAGVGATLFRGAGALLTVALVVGGCWFIVYVACGYGLTTPVIVLEELSSSFDAFGRSWELTRTFKLKLLGLAVIAYLIANFVPSAFVGGVGAYAALANPSLQPAVIVVSAL